MTEPRIFMHSLFWVL